MWRVGRERILLIGGPASLLLQLAHPLVAAAVRDHSDFRRDPFARLRATLEPTLRIMFGDSTQAEDAARSVRRTHARVRGVTGEGEAYDAKDPSLSLWVHASLVWVSMKLFEAFVEPLGPERRARYYEEGKRFAAMFDVSEALLPRDADAFGRYVDDMVAGGELALDDRTRDMADMIVRPPLPAPLRPAIPPMRLVTAWLLPPRVRAMYGLRFGSMERRVLAAAMPAARASLRLLPPSIRFWPHAAVAERRSAAAGEVAS